MDTNPTTGYYTVVYTGPQRAPPVPQQQLYDDKQAGHVKRMGIVQLVMGAVAIICGSINIFVMRTCTTDFDDDFTYCTYSVNGYVGTGIWAGIFILITGSITIASARRKTSGFINASVALNIINTVFSATLFGVAFADIFTMDTAGNAALDIIGMSIGMSQLVIAIILAAFGCRAVCSCCKHTAERQPLIQNSGNFYGGSNPHQVYNGQLPPAAVHTYQGANQGYSNNPQAVVIGQQQYQPFNNQQVYLPPVNALPGQLPPGTHVVYQTTQYTLPVDTTIQSNVTPSQQTESAPPTLTEEAAECPRVGNTNPTPPPYQEKSAL